MRKRFSIFINLSLPEFFKNFYKRPCSQYVAVALSRAGANKAIKYVYQALIKKKNSFIKDQKNLEKVKEDSFKRTLEKAQEPTSVQVKSLVKTTMEENKKETEEMPVNFIPCKNQVKRWSMQLLKKQKLQPVSTPKNISETVTEDMNSTETQKAQQSSETKVFKSLPKDLDD